MPLGTLVSGAQSFEPRKVGVYEIAGLALGAPRNEIRITAGRPNSKTKKTSLAVTRVRQKDFTPPGSTAVVREEANLSASFQVPNTGSFTQTEAVAMLNDINAVLTALIFARVASGEV